jgi:1-acyl-sn-glycerol-3-phosphate acyltransferase
LVPVVISGSFDVLPPRSLHVSPGPVLVRVLQPIDVTDFMPDDYNGLLNQVHQTMERALNG